MDVCCASSFLELEAWNRAYLLIFWTEKLKIYKKLLASGTLLQTPLGKLTLFQTYSQIELLGARRLQLHLYPCTFGIFKTCCCSDEDF